MDKIVMFMQIQYLLLREMKSKL